jgi:hypothetical protein
MDNVQNCDGYIRLNVKKSKVHNQLLSDNARLLE